MEASFRRLVEGAPDGVVISRDGIVLYANPSALRLLGYERSDEVIGKSMSLFLDGESLMTMRQRLQQMRETGQQPSPFEYGARRRDGERVTAEITSLFIEFDGAPAVLAFARDVTERVRMRAKLEQSDRLAALGLMAGGVAHEINNPLTFVTLAADQLERRVAAIDAPSEITKLVQDVRVGVARIAAIARDLRAYARNDDEIPSAVDLAAALDAAERLAAHQLRSRARLRRELGSVPRVRAVPMRLEQVFVNLLVNAANAVHDGRDDGEIVVTGALRDGSVVVEIADNGAGIAPDLLPQIFEPFFTTRSSGAGTGLGLSICRDIVQRMGGTIAARSDLGRGTTIELLLPCAADPTVDAAAPEHASAATSRRRILVIDDEPLIVATVKRVLGGVHDVVGVTDPQAGVDRVLADPTFDVVLCDLMMPGLTGMDVFARVARERPGIEQRFIFVSGGAFTRQTREFLQKVPNARLMKPFTADELVSAIASAPSGDANRLNRA
jgi:PAS domain S-box-containing protein